MSSADGRTVYWCHHCNVETRPPPSDDVLCTFCHQGFVEQLPDAEVEPGVPFSALPFVFSSLLRRPVPASVGLSRDRSVTDSPPPHIQAQQPQHQSSFGRNDADPQGHRPRILSGQLSGVPSLLEVMMQVIDEMNEPVLGAGRMRSGNRGENASQEFFVLEEPGSGEWREASGHREQVGSGETREAEASGHRQQPGLGELSETSGHRSEGHPHLPDAEDRGHNFVFSPTLILHGGTPNGFGSLEVLVDYGHGMGPQMIPNHMRDYFFGPDLDRLIQLLAENDPNSYGTPPAAKTEVEKLPKLKIMEEHLCSELLSQCAVCKDDFELEVEVNQMPCKHVYHPDCILPWLAQHNSCPICRYELPTDDADYEARKQQAASGDVNTILPERQGSVIDRSDSTSPNNDESSRDESRTSGQFTLWGIPSIGFDMNRMLAQPMNPSLSEDNSENVQHSASGQDQGAPREGGIREAVPVQWLFRLFSSGNLLGRENESNGGNQSPDLSDERDLSNT